MLLAWYPFYQLNWTYQFLRLFLRLWRFISKCAAASFGDSPLKARRDEFSTGRSSSLRCVKYAFWNSSSKTGHPGIFLLLRMSLLRPIPSHLYLEILILLQLRIRGQEFSSTPFVPLHQRLRLDILLKVLCALHSRFSLDHVVA
jgi:hypothetical protein